jgi:NAD(P)-dependent dehydrogenase (short-subunit alcohol dehydrogenase family)
MADLKDKVGIVTGGGTGIGRATALAMARAALANGNSSSRTVILFASLGWSERISGGRRSLRLLGPSVCQARDARVLRGSPARSKTESSVKARHMLFLLGD